jgi:hypothetical protein
MPRVDFKEDIKLDKQLLLEVGKILVTVKNDVEKINDRLSEFNTSKNNIFDETVEISTSWLDDCIEAIKIKLGTLELEYGGKK